MRYLDLADDLRGHIAAGQVGALPSEAELGETHGVSRVTVRRALELLREGGLVTSRRGAGWFVATDPVRQPLGRVTTIESVLEAAGARPERRVLEFGFEPATPEIVKILGIVADAEVLRVLRLNLADGEPFALVTVWLPMSVGAHVSRADVEGATFYDLLPLHGVEAGRVVQTISATAAESQWFPGGAAIASAFTPSSSAEAGFSRRPWLTRAMAESVCPIWTSRRMVLMRRSLFTPRMSGGWNRSNGGCTGSSMRWRSMPTSGCCPALRRRRVWRVPDHGTRDAGFD